MKFPAAHHIAARSWFSTPPNRTVRRPHGYSKDRRLLRFDRLRTGNTTSRRDPATFPLPSREIFGRGTTSALRDREVDYGSRYSRRDGPHTDIHSELHSGGVARLSDPKVFRLCLPGPRGARVGRSGAVRCGLGTRAWLQQPRLAVDGAFPPSRGHLRTAPGGVWFHVTSGRAERIHVRDKA